VIEPFDHWDRVVDLPNVVVSGLDGEH